ncbi:hypothetical protein GCM10015535_48860 [Streptomyces gelaticus]|uniref:Uncharacterized protein n=1 Tax=Streptomyces gelaticus TaxID=285446 RepID=A0ABQ2W3F7_9ACTN|nr:hypothetical protein GCM10015535_48860 [Streptomyces gelaticus]
MGEQQQQDARAQRECGGERSEGAGQYFGERVHPAVPEAREDAGGDIDQADGGAGGTDQRRYGFGARASYELAYVARNRYRLIPI